MFAGMFCSELCLVKRVCLVPMAEALAGQITCRDGSQPHAWILPQTDRGFIALLWVAVHLLSQFSGARRTRKAVDVKSLGIMAAVLRQP